MAKESIVYVDRLIQVILKTYGFVKCVLKYDLHLRITQQLAVFLQ